MIPETSAPGATAVPLLLDLREITKDFPGVRALDGISLDVRPGEIHAICGENGAGKSTLMKILAGAERADHGEIRMDGEVVHVVSPVEAHRVGISMIYQELNLTPQLSVSENVYAGALPRRAGVFVDWGLLHRLTSVALQRMGANFSSRSLVGDLSVAQRQLVEIAKALIRSSRVLIMDEPTASLTPFETDRLLALIRGLRAQGLSILYVSHRLEEVFSIADRITVLRDGRLVSTQAAADTSPRGIVRLMVGRDVTVGVETPPLAHDERIALDVRGLRRRGVFEDVTFQVRVGEIVGMYGLIGSGRTECARAIFGLDPYDGGEVRIDGQRLPPERPWAALEHGLAYASEDRKGLGLVLLLPVGANIAMAALDACARGPFSDERRETALADDIISRLDVRPANASILARQLSGGNQQKVVIGKWLATAPSVLLLDEPTRGVDVGAKHEIYLRIAELAAEGRAVVVISSELPELLVVPHRVLVMRDGRLVGELARGEVSEESLMGLATGVGHDRSTVVASSSGQVIQ